MIRPWLEGRHFRSIQCFLGLWDRKAASSSCCWLGQLWQLWQLCLNFHGSFRTQTSCTSLVRPSRSDGSRACGSIPDHLACRAGHKTTPSSNCKACHSGLEDFKESICKKRQPHRDRERERVRHGQATLCPHEVAASGLETSPAPAVGAVEGDVPGKEPLANRNTELSQSQNPL